MLDRIKNFILSMISEDNGNVSTMRVLSILIIVVALFNWTYASVSIGSLAALDWEAIALVLGTLTAKSVQKKLEK